MNASDLCMALMRADTEANVISLLTETGYWNEPLLWRPIGDNENNFSTIGNQQSEAIAALVEKVVNGVDARLLGACLEAGINPTGPEAPRGIREAVARFFENKDSPAGRDGYIADWTDSEATTHGRLLTVAATGHMPKEGNPSISIADQGEGQTPDSFPATFMSLGKSNKLRIPFVQGKFNMGGTGALQFCGGEAKVQLVVSRRNPALLGPDAPQRDHQWGFTVVRRQPPAAGSRSSVFTYLAPVDRTQNWDGKVLAFHSEEWPIFPEADEHGRGAYRRSAPYGSLVKLYEYEWQGTKTNIVMASDGLLRRIDVGLPELALPVRVFECRQPYRGHRGSFSTNALGLVSRLDRDRGNNLEDESPVGGVIALEGKQIRVRIYAFLADKAKNYRNARHGVIFTVNGQMHGAFTIDFFRRKAVKMGYLADSLMVVVDCTAIDGQMREDLFMNSRDRLRDTPLSRQLEDALESFLRNEPTLRELQNRRREEVVSERLEEDKPLLDVLQGLLRRNPILSKLLLQGLKLSSPFPPGKGSGVGGSSTFDGKRFPTYFRFKGLEDGDEYERDAHLGSRVRVAFETDAEDDYFVRDVDPGAWNVRVRTAAGYADASEWTTTGPKSGIAQLWIERLPDSAAEGEQVEYLIEVTDPSRVDAFQNRLLLKMRPSRGPTSDGSGRSTSANTGKGTKGGASSLALPKITPVSREDWEKPSLNFNEETALKVLLSNGGDDDESDAYDFFVNIDNKYLKIAQKESKTDHNLLEKQFMYGMVLVGLALLQDSKTHTLGATMEDAGEDNEEANIERVVEISTRALAPVFLPMLEAIGSLSLDEL